MPKLFTAIIIYILSYGLTLAIFNPFDAVEGTGIAGIFIFPIAIVIFVIVAGFIGSLFAHLYDSYTQEEQHFLSKPKQEITLTRRLGNTFIKALKSTERLVLVLTISIMLISLFFKYKSAQRYEKSFRISYHHICNTLKFDRTLRIKVY